MLFFCPFSEKVIKKLLTFCYWENIEVVIDVLHSNYVRHFIPAIIQCRRCNRSGLDCFCRPIWTGSIEKMGYSRWVLCGYAITLRLSPKKEDKHPMAKPRKEKRILRF